VGGSGVTLTQWLEWAWGAVVMVFLILIVLLQMDVNRRVRAERLLPQARLIGVDKCAACGVELDIDDKDQVVEVRLEVDSVEIEGQTTKPTRKIPVGFYMCSLHFQVAPRHSQAALHG
jgi:hypothetical protein